MNDFVYAGSELALFAEARRWKSYWAANIKRFLVGDVLEVGAGLGANTPALRDARQNRWLCLEPDPALAKQLAQRLAAWPSNLPCECSIGTVAGLPKDELFDVLLYVDVLEHIEDDAEELRQAARHLRPSGSVLVVSPAHEWLRSPFDDAIGHFRRYDKRRLPEAGALTLDKAFYLDSVGLLASLGNRLLLGQSMPTLKQIRTWDRLMIPCSRVVDVLTGYRLGKSIVAIWKKTG